VGEKGYKGSIMCTAFQYSSSPAFHEVLCSDRATKFELAPCR
jgi:hypothetical protein